MTMLVLYAILSTTLWYLGSRAVITRALWSRYPHGVASFMDCPACTGFWWGTILALCARLTSIVPDTGLHPMIVGLASIFLTACGAGIMQHALTIAGSAVEPGPPPLDTPAPDWQRIE